MGLLRSKKKSEFKNKLTHIMAAFIIFIHGYEKLEEHTSSAIFFLISGAVFLLIAIFHHKLVQHVRSVDAVFSLIEGLLAAIVAADFFNDHKHYIQYAYVFAAAVYLVRSFILFRTAPKPVNLH